MKTLVDAVLESNNQSYNPADFDEYGLPLNRADELDYTAARVFARNPKLYLNEEDGRLYIKHRPISETYSELMRLSNIYNQWTRPSRAQLVWNRIHEVAPRYSSSRIWITDELLWDIDNQELIKQSPKENHI